MLEIFSKTKTSKTNKTKEIPKVTRAAQARSTAKCEPVKNCNCSKMNARKSANRSTWKKVSTRRWNDKDERRRGKRKS